MNNTEDFGKRSIKVSVVMPIYNAYKYLRPALDSVLDQTLSDIELICVDDGSTDHSLDIVKEYQQKDGRVRILTETNAGPAVARNNGLRRARGEYVAFLDADDFFEPTLLEKLYEKAEGDNLDIAIAKYDIYNSKTAKFRENIESEQASIFAGGVVTSKNEHPDTVLQSTTGSAWNKLFRRSFISEKKISFLPEFKMFEDVYFTTCAMAFAERVGKVHEVLIHHRVYKEQTRVKMYKKYFSQVPEVYLEIKKFLMRGGMYEPLSVGFLNFSAERSLYIYNLLPTDAKYNFWQMLHESYAELLGWEERAPSDFQKSEVCEFCANVQMYTHDQYIKRCSAGAKLKIETVDQTLRRDKKRKKFVKALRKFFGIKKR